jgi:serine/threonine protein kinase
MHMGAAPSGVEAETVAMGAGGGVPESPQPIEQETSDDALFLRVRDALTADYDVKRELGRGGMAVVYEATERELHRRVAIKVLPPETATGDAAERFKREARLAASLDHQNIIPVYRVGTVAGLQYMAMKFVEGRGLDEIIKEQGALPIPVVVRVLTHAARGLAYGHKREIIHRDIKGANILIETDGRVTVADFGIARAMGEHTITATGMVVGTPSFMSPEQCGGMQLGPQADQYSLGIMAFQMLTGRLPFEADSLIGVVQHHYMTPPPDVREVRDDIPPELYQVIYRALEKKAENRFPTTDHMVAALERVPQTEDQKSEGERVLIELVTGEKVERISISNLPELTTPLTTPMTPAPAVAVPPPVQKKSRAPVMAFFAFVVLGGVAAGVGWQMGVFTPEPTVQAPPPIPEFIVNFTDLPDGARISVEDVPISGTQATADSGQPFVYNVSAPGYRDYPGMATALTNPTTVSLRNRMQPIQTQQPTRRETTPVRQTRYGQVLARVTPGTAVRIELTDVGVTLENGLNPNVPVGRHPVRITAPGCNPYTTEVQVVEGQQARLIASLTCQ